MLRLQVEEIQALRLTPGGVKFTSFVDDLLRSQAYLCAVKQSQISTNVRTNLGDGGVDSKVEEGFSIDPIGFNSVKTVWQYKATGYADLTEKVIKDEVRKAFVSECIKNGFAYRLAVCDSLPAPAKKEREEWLNNALKEVFSDAQEGKLVSAEELCVWANMLPAVMSRHFEKGFTGVALRLDSWGKNITEATPKYLDNPSWNEIEKAIIASLDFLQEEDVLLSITGPAGVGKTRFVYETLTKMHGAHGLVLYTQDEQRAQELANYLANDETLSALLIADECSLQSQEKLRSKLRGHKSRIRVIAIDAGTEEGISGDLFLGKQTPEQVAKILEINFPAVPSDRRRSYAELAGGFVRLAADMCSNDAWIMSKRGFTSPTKGLKQKLSTYLSLRLSQSDRTVIQALALCTKVGYKAEFERELLDLSQFIGIDSQSILDAAQRLHDAPGFIGKGGRFLYVTPEIVAQLAFDEAWVKWFADEEFSKLSKIPPKMLDSFLTRVARSASEEVRRTVGDHFLQWATGIKPIDLWDIHTVERFVVLIEAVPQTFLPILRSVIASSSKEILSKHHLNSFSKSPRRLLVWLCDKLVAFNEYFYDAEFILLQLAEAENEPSLGNNATRVWQQLFLIALSGTPINFTERIDLLKKRVFSPQWEIAIGALEKIITTRESRMGKGGIIAGRIPPQEWHPETTLDYRNCFEQVVAVLVEMSQSGIEYLSAAAFDLSISKLHQLLRYRFLSEVKVIAVPYLSDFEKRAKVRRSLELFLQYEGIKKTNAIDKESNSYFAEILDWSETLSATDIFDRVVETFGVASWDRAGALDGEDYSPKVQNLAQELLTNLAEFERVLPWLCSDRALSSDELGFFLGQLDASMKTYDAIASATMAGDNVSLLRGYVSGNLKAAPNNAQTLVAELDKLTEQDPLLGYHASLGSPKLTRALDRCMRCIDRGQLHLEQLYPLMHSSNEELPASDFLKLIKWLLTKEEKERSSAIVIGLSFISIRIRKNDRTLNDSLLKDPSVQSAIWQFLLLDEEQKFAEEESYSWKTLLSAMISLDASAVAKYAAKGLTVSGVKNEDYAIELLLVAAETNVTQVLKEVESVISNPENRYQFVFTKLTRLFEELPFPPVKDWLKLLDTNVVKAVARHLKPPFVTQDGALVVPELTEFVLQHFEENESIFREFCASVHSGIVMSGDIATQRLQDAEVARKFLNHPIRRVREWAAYEIETSLAEAKRWQSDDEEDFLD